MDVVDEEDGPVPHGGAGDGEGAVDVAQLLGAVLHFRLGGCLPGAGDGLDEGEAERLGQAAGEAGDEPWRAGRRDRGDPGGPGVGSPASDAAHGGVDELVGEGPAPLPAGADHRAPAAVAIDAEGAALLHPLAG